MSQERVARLNEFAKHGHPGLVGVEVRNETKNRTITLFRRTQMILYPKQ